MDQNLIRKLNAKKMDAIQEFHLAKDLKAAGDQCKKLTDDLKHCDIYILDNILEGTYDIIFLAIDIHTQEHILFGEQEKNDIYTFHLIYRW